MPKYQVTLNLGRTDTVDLIADSLIDVQGLYENLSEAKITIIKKYVYINASPDKTAFSNYYRELKLLIGQTTLNLNKFLVIRFIKPLLTKDFIKQKAKEYLEFNGKRVDYVHNIIRHI